MQKKELLRHINEQFGDIEELEEAAMQLHAGIKKLRRKMEDLPSEESEIETDDE